METAVIGNSTRKRNGNRVSGAVASTKRLSPSFRKLRKARPLWSQPDGRVPNLLGSRIRIM